MSSLLKNAAVAAVTKRQPSSFYDRDNRPNPMLQALDQELKLFLSFLKKRSQPGSTKCFDAPYGRQANTLFEIWNKYQPCLPQLYYENKVLEVGEFLVSLKEYKLALWQCYERYLQPYGDINVETTTDIDNFQTTFYPNGPKAENTALMSKAIMGKCICMYHEVRLDDPKLQNNQSVERCLQILSMLRLCMQVILPKESLCWLVYNGTIHIYTVARHLMSLGHSSTVLEYLLWATMCMETSVPLLTAKYLSWRATLYTAVCQCYFDGRAGEQAENFARRGLVKIHELSSLELLSSSKSMPVYEESFRSATVRMAVLVFRRAVFETRRKPKGLLRPKTRANLKEVLHMPWPRTPTETMLSDMFDGGSAQFLAILESINDSNRRVLQTSPAASENEPEILDVFCELMMAAQEVMAGGGGRHAPGTKSQMAAGAPLLNGVALTGSLIQLAGKGEDTVPLESVIRLMKLAYTYEHWELFETLLTPVLTLIKESNNEQFDWDEKSLKLLAAMQKVNPNWQQKKQTSTIEVEEVEKIPTDAQSKKAKPKMKPTDKPTVKQLETVEPPKSNYGDDLINVAAVLMNIVSGTYQQTKIEVDLVVDATLFLWNKCKPVFQKFQTGLIDSHRFLQKMGTPGRKSDLIKVASDRSAADKEGKEEKIEFTERTPRSAWIYLLTTVHEALTWCGISSVDPILAAEVGLRLAMVYESLARLDSQDGSKSAQRESRTTVVESESAYVAHNPSASFTTQLSLDVPVSAKENLIQARNILELALANVDCACRTVAVNDGKDIADVTCMKDTTKEKTMKNDQVADAASGAPGALKATIADLHLELLLTYHRICLKLCAQNSDKSDKRNAKQDTMDKKENPEVNSAEKYKEDFNELCNRCNKNYLSKALLLAQRAVTLGTEQGPTAKQKKLLEDAVSLVQRAQMEEKRIVSDNTDVNKINVRGKVPPPPILVCRTDTYMVFRPAPFEPESEEKVAWYRIFARCAVGSNVKVRLSDNNFPGTGEEVPSFNCEVKVTNLEPNERYVFSVAAYTADGKLVGDCIGDTSKPFLAFNPLPVLMAWAFVSQLAYQVGYYSISRQACSLLWNHFVEKPSTTVGDTYISGLKKDFKISLLRLNQQIVEMSSPVLLRHVLNSVFINADIAIKEGQLFCDVICDKGIFYDSQIQRLQQCERLMVAVELAGWLNEASLALQAVVQIYGLLTPLIYHKIPSVSAVQLLEKCHSVLLEIPSDLLKKCQSSISDSLNHMIACITYYLTKTLRAFGQKSIANSIYASGQFLLAFDGDVKFTDNKTDGVDVPIESSEKGAKVKRLSVGQKRITMKGTKGINQELNALDALVCADDQSDECKALLEQDLSGSDDPSVFFAYISCMPSSVSFKEVEKFKSKPHYLQSLVYVAQKGLAEGLADQVIQLWTDSIKWFNTRNINMAAKVSYVHKQPGAVIVGGEDPKMFAAAMVEYKKEKGGKTEKVTATKQINKKRAKYKPLRVRPSMSETSQKRQEEAELKALDVLNLHLVNRYKSRVKSQMFRKTAYTEMPWRSQMNLIQGMSHFTLLQQNIDRRDQMFGISAKRANYLDHEWFTLETVGVMIVGGSCVPSKEGAALDAQRPSLSGKYEQAQLSRFLVDRPLIELAAAAVIDASHNVSSDKEHENLPQISRSEKISIPTELKVQDGPSPLTASVATEALRKTFGHLERAMVLAHRGQYWALLQNTGRVLWNCAYTALQRTCIPSQGGGDPAGLLTPNVMWTLLWHPFYVAADCLLDMMTVLQDVLEKRVKSRSKILGDSFESWVGNIQSERGGPSLKFDPLLDDASTVDVRWIRRLTLRTLELLYTQQKYEKLVDVALRFSALTNNRYAEQVIPLIVQAQKMLKKRILEAGGPYPPQPHFKILQAQLGRVVHAKDYLKTQLRLRFDQEVRAPTEPGLQTDVIGRGAYTKKDAFRLSSVPLDTAVTLQDLQDTLDQAHYPARALQHSRKLLCLYLAGQQNVKEGVPNQEVPHVDFKMAVQKPHPTMPPQKITSDFSSAEDVAFSPLPQSQHEIVISSYEKTIEILRAKNLKGTSAQAMHELGNVCFLAQNTRGACKWWCQSLDLVLNTNDAIHAWRGTVQNVEDISATFLEKCGLWGCLLAGVLSSNIAQYIVTDDDCLRMECCLLAGFLFKALLRSSLPHPKADRDYALYDVGEGCEVTSVTPGLDFMSDKFRCDGRQLVAALKWVIEELSRAQYNLFVLPLLTLSQYFTTCVCQDIQQTVASRILRVRILTDLGLYAEALVALQLLFNGERLPQAGNNGFRQKSKDGDMNYNTSKSPVNPLNLKAGCKANMESFITCRSLWNKYNYLVIESLLFRRLSVYLSALFGPHLTCHLALVQAHLFVSLANTIPVLTRTDENMPIVEKPKGEIQQRILSNTTKNLASVPANTGKSVVPSKVPEVEIDDKAEAQSIFTVGNRSVTLEEMKYIVLAVAEQLVTGMMNVITEKAQKDKQGTQTLSAAELELVVQCHLEQTRIAQQRHHAPMAAHTMLEGMKMLQNAWIFKIKTPHSAKQRSSMKSGSTKGSHKPAGGKSTQPENHQFQYQNLQARLRLDSRLWLQCRHELVRSLMAEIRGMGEIKENSDKVISDLGDCRQYCAEGLGEAEVRVNHELQAHFLYLGAQLNVVEGKCLKNAITLLEDAVRRLRIMSQCSDKGQELLVNCIIFKTDLEAIAKSEVDPGLLVQGTLNSYLDAHRIILNQMELLGENIEHQTSDGQAAMFSSPTSPLQNVYLPYVQRLVEVKLRIGHALARESAKKALHKSTGDPLSLWADSLGVLTTALEISQVSTARNATLESEILFMMGKVQKMMVYLGKYETRAAVYTFLKAIKISYLNGHDLGLMRQAYLEIALSYLYSTQSRRSSAEPQVDPATDADLSARTSTEQITKTSTDYENEKDKSAISLAIRCAVVVAHAQAFRNTITGNITVSSDVVDAKVVAKLPAFVSMDLLNRTVLGKKQITYKDDVEEELAEMLESQEAKGSETYWSRVKTIMTAANALTWIHLLGYQNILQRLVNTATFSVSGQQACGGGESGGSKPDSLGKTSFHSGMNHDVVKYMLHSGGWSVRLAAMHSFLSANLRTYADNCCAPFIPADLSLPRQPYVAGDAKVTTKSYAANIALNMDVDLQQLGRAWSNSIKVPLPPGSNADIPKPDEQITTLGTEPELSVQWYQPDLEEAGHLSGNGTAVVLLYSCIDTEQRLTQGLKWVDLQKVYELHDRITALAQKADISTFAKKEHKPLPFASKSKVQQRNRTSSLKTEQIKHQWMLFKHCLDDAWTLIKGTPRQKEHSDPEFNIDNINNLESVFDPNLGLTLKGTDLLPWLLKLFK